MTIIISELIAHCDIRAVWAALGGGPVRHGRGRAFWRGGVHLSVALNSEKNVWFDHATGQGGGTLALVQRVTGCNFREAVRWLDAFRGGSEKSDRGESRPVRDRGEAAAWVADQRWARWWAYAATVLAEEILWQLDAWDLRRESLTAMLRAIRLGDGAVVDQYRTWRAREPALTRALARAGRRADVRLQRRLAAFVVGGPHGS
jgi:hypothetical protein